MNIDHLINNHKYYDGYEGEDEVMISLRDRPSVNIHFWLGYLDDILKNPDFTGKGWRGLTRDYHQMEGAFSNAPDSDEFFDPEEYICDLSQYSHTKFEFPESMGVLNLITQLLTYALSINSFIKIRVN